MVSALSFSLFFVTLQLLNIQVSAEQRYIRALRYYPEAAALQSRQNAFVGGWALRALQCPLEYNKCEETRGVPTCCPKNTVCVREGYKDMPVCCAKGEDCLTTLQSVPMCASADWVLWKGPSSSDDPFCCLKGEMGYVTKVSGRFPACGPTDLEIEATQKATTLRPATARAGGASYSTPTGTASTPSSTSYSTSYSTSSSTSPSRDQESSLTSSQDTSSGAISTDPGSLSSSNSKASDNSSSGLSTGAIIGIIVGIVIVIITIALLIFFIVRMKRKNAKLAAQVSAERAAAAAAAAAKPQPVASAMPLPVKAEYSPPNSDAGWYGPNVNTELDGRNVNNFNPRVPELDGGRRV